MKNTPNYKSLSARLAIIASSSVLFVSCDPTQNQVITETSKKIGVARGNAIYQQISPQLEEPSALIEDMRVVALKFKTNYANDPTILSAAEKKYSTARISLNAARESLKNDISNGNKSASDMTSKHFEQFQTDGNAFRAYYGEVSNEGRFSSALLVGLGLIDKLLNTWNSYDGAKTDAVNSAIDQKLQSKPWSSL